MSSFFASHLLAPINIIDISPRLCYNLSMQRNARSETPVLITPPLYNDIAFLRDASKNYEFGAQNANFGEFCKAKLGKQGFVLRHKHTFNRNLNSFLKPCRFMARVFEENSVSRAKALRQLKAIPKPFGGFKCDLKCILKPFGHFKCHLNSFPKPFGHFKCHLNSLLKPFGHFKCHLKSFPKPFGHFKCHLKALLKPFGHFKCHLKSFLKPLGGFYEGNPVDFLG